MQTLCGSSWCDAIAFYGFAPSGNNTRASRSVFNILQISSTLLPLHLAFCSGATHRPYGPHRISKADNVLRRDSPKPTHSAYFVSHCVHFFRAPRPQVRSSRGCRSIARTRTPGRCSRRSSSGATARPGRRHAARSASPASATHRKECDCRREGHCVRQIAKSQYRKMATKERGRGRRCSGRLDGPGPPARHLEQCAARGGARRAAALRGGDC